MFGMPLIDLDDAARLKRRIGPYIVASSYGPVYGVLRNNGLLLYIVDGINLAEHEFDLTRGLNGEEIVPTDVDRREAWPALRAQLEEVKRFYGY